MKKILFTLVVIVSSVFHLQAQSEDEIEFMEPKSFLVVKTTKRYAAALRKAQKAANDLQIPMDLRGLYADKEKGLHSNEVCGCGLEHGYVARGRYDDGKYISIEYSSAYEEANPERYLVVVASGTRKEINMLYPEVKSFFKRTEIIHSDVYMGSMH